MNTIRSLGALAVFLTTIAISSAAEATASEASASDAGPSINYRLAPNDLVTIKVFQEEDLTTAARLAADGTITLPMAKAGVLAGSCPATSSPSARDCFNPTNHHP